MYQQQSYYKCPTHGEVLLSTTLDTHQTPAQAYSSCPIQNCQRPTILISHVPHRLMETNQECYDGNDRPR